MVVLDWTMPRLSGGEALQQMARISHNVRALFASGYSSGPTEDLSQNEHVVGFIAKPYRGDILAEAVRTALDAWRGADKVSPG